MNFVETKFDQRSPEWFQARCGCVTASNAAKVLATIKTGEAAERRNYRAKLVVERLTGKPVESFSNAAMERGTELEPHARMAYECQSTDIVIESGFWCNGEIGASPDGLIGSDGLLEIKCPTLATHIGYLKAGVMPAEYIPQVQMQLWVTGRQWCDFVSYAPEFPEGLQLFVIRVQRDEPFITNLKTEVEKFLCEVVNEVQALNKIAA